ncbi:SusD/RagB family nutrient-binding outer membrane lipoprotein [Arcticibacterium luteifluviistationis]|uniref:SusD/RagB family nutrient-binding outer membrane lipoprotein n=1 Tax=Arcticibacterium luteifluviistationis TaxID=1784714 RepID=A0A2Z4GEH8_9BACT|nr:SusD/RagB family nutrient-binding outer membrane lipoprotein [Arcticibacterium luteifluviistationis]AWV99243.1 SusD/RagB family nutrient-binding outer membrane lipoprotein [Arcticibacterium luteifluviistationis]
MKINNKIFLSAFAGIMLVFANSCTDDFEELNTDPNNPTAIGSQYLLPYAIEESVDRYWGGTTRFERLNLDGAMLWIQYLARNIYSNEGDSYGISPAFYNNTWESLYNDGLTNFQRIQTLSADDGISPNTNYEGIALVMKSWVFSLLTDMYGAVPYSQAVAGAAAEPIYTPEYDTMEAVYAGLLADLKEANEKLSVDGPTVAGDILYNGDILKWKKFANSLRLKLANRQAAKKSAESQAIMSEILGSPSTYPIFTSNDDNAQLVHTATRPSNNAWNEVMVQGGRTDWSMSKTFVDLMTGADDPRLGAIATSVNGTYSGIPNGLPDAIATTYLSSASILQDSFSEAEAPSVLMTFSELNFVLAEAALDGDISGDADAYFTTGLEASFESFGLTKPDGFETSFGSLTKETIMTQKYVALFGQGIEAWTEYRRTGFPVMPTADPRAIFENDGIIPTRLPYPTTEYSLNRAKLDAGISLNGGADNMQTELWWAE